MSWREALAAASLEGYLCAPALFGLQTASPLQRAFCRIAEGQPLADLDTADLREACGDVSGIGRPKELVLLSGIRTGKSILAAVLATYATQHCDLSVLQPGEMPRVSIVSLRTDLADVVLRHLSGGIHASRILSRLIVRERKDSLILQHPSGRPVEIKVVAGARAGATLVARWSAGVIFDEAPRMQGGDEAVVNLDDARTAVQGRLLPGAQIFSLGSPWAPFGPVYDLDVKHFGRPSSDIVVFRAPAHKMNPHVWTQQVCDELRQRAPDAYVTDVLAKYRQPESGLFGSELDRCVRDVPLVVPPERDAWGRLALEYVAAIDPATRGNAWTLVVATIDRGVRRVVLARQWQGSKTEPLRPEAVFCEIAKAIEPYGLKRVYSDPYGRDFVQEAAHKSGLYVYQVEQTSHEQTEIYLRMQSDMMHGKFELPNDPQLLSDLRHLTKRTTQTGLAIHLPVTSDGRHCDYAPALMLASRAYVEDLRVAAEARRIADDPTKHGARETARLIANLENPPKRARAGFRYR